MQLTLKNGMIIQQPIEEGLKSLLNNHHYSKMMVISDHHVYALHGAAFMSHLPTNTSKMILPPGESAKSLKSVQKCWVEMHAQGLDRHSLVIGFGGGVITDLAGYSAGCYMRGIDVAFVPTTLLGMVDAAIGGKCGVNLPNSKNLIGLIHHPKYVFISPHYLSTLPEREFRAGLAEVIKYGVILDPDFFNFLEKNIKSILERRLDLLDTIISKACQLKAEIVQADDRELGRRSILNWGHTVAHALEAATHYATYLHGEAVAIGMHCAASISNELGYVDQLFVSRQETLLMRVGLPTLLPKQVSVEELISLMKQDKKTINGRLSFIIAKGFGNVLKVDDVAEDVVAQVLSTKKSSMPLCEGTQDNVKI